MESGQVPPAAPWGLVLHKALDGNGLGVILLNSVFSVDC